MLMLFSFLHFLWRLNAGHVKSVFFINGGDMDLQLYSLLPLNFLKTFMIQLAWCSFWIGRKAARVSERGQVKWVLYIYVTCSYAV